MSRVGKMPVAVPQGVDVAINEAHINVKGSGGNLSIANNALVKVVRSADNLSFEPANESREANAMSGTLRQLVNNMVVGVTKGFEKKLNLAVGYSHPVNFDMPSGIKVETPVPTEIIIKGADRQRVGQIAAEIRAVRPPEP